MTNTWRKALIDVKLLIKKVEFGQAMWKKKTLSQVYVIVIRKTPKLNIQVFFFQFTRSNMSLEVLVSKIEIVKERNKRSESKKHYS